MSNIKVDFNKKLGDIKPMHGVCNGPTSWGGLTDISRSWKNAGFPFARMHDPEYPHGTSVDIPQIFPNFDADENNPENYRFTNTDYTLNAIRKCDAEIIYRLGTSIEHTAEKLHTDVPSDMEKWSRICINVIRHYNEGWADGYHWNIKYWEIWNEADLAQDDMWKGTPEQYYELYTTSSKMIKKEFPNLLVGGPALAGYGHEEFIRGFLESIIREKAPLDFFSWHLYRSDISEFIKASELMRSYLDEYGFKNTITICDEWNMGDFGLENDTEENEQKKIAYFGNMTNEIGMAMYSAVMTTFQKGCLDIATYYDSHPTNLWCGIFDRYGVPTKSYYSFKMFDKLYRLNGKEIYTSSDNDNIYTLCASNNDKAYLIVTNYNGKDTEITIDLENINNFEYNLYLSDKDKTLELIEKSDAIKITKIISKNSILFFEIML